MSKLAHFVFLLTLGCTVLVGCGGSSSAPNPVPSSPATPAPTPTPAPAVCGAPTPPPLVGFRMKVQNDQGFKKVLDSRPLVGKDAAYCARVGQPGDTCVTRDESAPDATACDNLVVGTASETNRLGPNWYVNDQPCRDVNQGGDAQGCRHHPTNQYLVFAFGPGTYSVCGDKDRVCHGLEVN